MEIKSQINEGENQHFADAIINQYPNLQFGQEDIELLKFIAESKTKDAYKNTVAQAIAVANDEAANFQAQNTAHNRISQFLLDQQGNLSEWGERISVVMLKAILAKYGLTMADVGL